jgi:hypothetical protein
MALPEDWEGTFQNNQLHKARMQCPHCKHASTFSVLSSHLTYIDNRSVVVNHAVLQCDYPQCRGTVFVMTSKASSPTLDQKPSDLLIVYPKRKIDKVHTAIPPAVGEDWVEAQKAFNEGAFKAAAVMCRRVLYGVLLHKKCKEHPLHEGIAELVAQARLPQVVEQWLGEIKDDGHDAAHPFRALSVPAENVAETMEYTKELLRFVYIEPHELRERLTRKSATQAPAKP